MATSRILLDVGGTFIKCSDGRQVPVPSGGTAGSIADALKEAIFVSEGPVEVGVAIPGPFDFRKGIFLMKHKFASVYGMSFCELVGLPVGSARFIHDVNAVLEGSIAMLGLQDRNVALVTIGTGLGFSYSVKGKVQCGPMLSPARVGAESAYDVAKRAYSGEIEAQEVYNGVGEALSDVLPGILDELGIDMLLMAGQIAKSMNLFDRPIRNALEWIPIERAPEGAVFKGIESLFAPASSGS